MSSRRFLAAGLMAAALTVGASAVALAAAPDTQFFVYEGDTQSEPVVGGTITVCTFHLEAIPTGTDDHETGNWEIRAADGSVVQSGTYETIGNQGDRIPDTGTMSLPNGTYQLAWDSEPIDTSHWTKEFAVSCAAVAPTATGPGVQPTGDVLPTTGVNPTGAAVTLPPTDVEGTQQATFQQGGTLLVVLALAFLSAVVLVARPRFTVPVRGRSRSA